MKDLPLFDHLKPEQRMSILELAAKHDYGAGRTLFHEGEDKKALYLITKGKVKLWKSFPGGKKVTLWIARPGDVLGEDSLFVSTKHRKNATTIEDSFICACYKSEFELFVKDNPELAVRIIKNLGEKLSHSENWRGLLAGHDKKSQLGRLMIRLADRFGTARNGSTKIDLDVTHRDLADFLGASRVTVTNSLGALPGVKTDNSHIRVDREKLEGFLAENT